MQETDNTKKFTDLLSEPEHCREEDQKQKIAEMNGIIDEMDGIEIHWTFTKELFNKMDKMIEEKKISMENVIRLLKHVGFCKVILNLWCYGFYCSSLRERIEKMIIEENEKKEEKIDNLLTDLCECYLLFVNILNSELIPICMSCLLKIALNKQEDEETQKEVELALLALNNTGLIKNDKELHLNKITEIIKYHQEHHNLTQLAYQSAWRLLVNRLWVDNCLEEVIVNELHFVREAARELEELSKCVDWTRKDKENGGKEEKKEFILMGWIHILENFFNSCKLKSEEIVELIESIVRVFQASRDCNRMISKNCIHLFGSAAETRNTKINAFVKGNVIDLFFEEMNQTTLEDEYIEICLNFFVNITKRLNKEGDDEMEEEERKATKRKVLEKMEEEGYEDAVASFHEIFDFLKGEFGPDLSFYISDYFVNA